MRFNLTRAYLNGEYVAKISGDGLDLCRSPTCRPWPRPPVPRLHGDHGHSKLAPTLGKAIRHGPGRRVRRC